MSYLHRLSSHLEKFEGALAALGLLFMIMLAFLQVVLRNFWDTAIDWGDPIVRALVLWVGFLGASIATHRRSHIRFDVVSKFLPPHARHSAEVVFRTVSTIVCFLLAMAAYEFVMSEKEFGTMLVEGIPSWIALSILPISFLTMSLRMAVLSLEDLLVLMKINQEDKS